MIYLDCNATTPVDPEVSEAMYACLREVFGNPSSSHLPGQRARARVEEARAHVAGLIGCEPEEVFFTSGGTESNNLAITGTALRHGKGHIITSGIEHPSVMNTVKHLQDIGFNATFVGVDSHCRVSPDEINSAIREDTVLITIMHSNNETGTLQPVGEIAQVARSRRVAFHTDAAQSVGKVEVSAGHADMVTIAGHKFYGPKGVGALYIKRGFNPSPIMFGAGHERGIRPGTENVSGIAGLGKAAEIAKRDLQARIESAMKLRALLLEGLKKSISGVGLNGHPSLTLPGTLNVVLPGTNSAEVVNAFGTKLAVSAGSACHEGVNTPSAVLKAMGIGDAEAMASIRISIGKDNTEEEIRAAAQMLSETAAQMARKR
jgi:cysteine desulfurase